MSDAAKLIVIARNWKREIDQKFDPVIENSKYLKSWIECCRKTAVDIIISAESILFNKLAKLYLNTFHDPKEAFLAFSKVWKYRASG
ncbi:MAG: hypothetical protein SNJ78_12905 [Spirochaetales bacterium]